MTRFQNYTISINAMRQAWAANLTPDYLKMMARRAAVVTHPLGNRRFEDWVLLVNEDQILSISPFNTGTSEEGISLSNDSQ